MTHPKDFGAGILAREYTCNSIRCALPFQPMDAMQARGRSESVLAYSLEITQIA